MKDQEIADRARRAAVRISNIADEVVQSFVSADAEVRVSKLKSVTTQILVEMAAAASWLAMRNPHEADLLNRRLLLICDEARACAACDAPEYAGGKLPVPGTVDEPSAGVQRTAALLVSSKFVAQSIDLLADMIEREAQQSSLITRLAASAAKEDEGTREKPDGPFPPNGFRWQGNEYRGLAPLPWRLLNHLWSVPNRRAAFETLAEPVWQDHAKSIDGPVFGDPRSKLNRFFLDNGLPFEVRSKACTAILERTHLS